MYHNFIHTQKRSLRFNRKNNLHDYDQPPCQISTISRRFCQALCSSPLSMLRLIFQMQNAEYLYTFLSPSLIHCLCCKYQETIITNSYLLHSRLHQNVCAPCQYLTICISSIAAVCTYRRRLRCGPVKTVSALCRCGFSGVEKITYDNF